MSDIERPLHAGPASAGQPWSEQDDYDLRWALQREMPINEIATFLEREEDDVRGRVAELDKAKPRQP